MNPLYLPKTLGAKLAWLNEELAELSAAISKTQRIADEHGLEKALFMYNPEAPVEKRETNRAWIERELSDVLLAAAELQQDPFMQRCISGNRSCGHTHQETFTCKKCKELVCWCAGGDEDELCNQCFAELEAAKENRRAKRRKSHVRKASGKQPRQKLRQPAKSRGARGKTKP